MVAKILLIDNYDSFTYNLYQYFGELGAEVTVIRNDQITPEQALNLGPSHLVLSPGPKRPEDAGVCNDMIKAFEGKTPILGVCLGHQCMGYTYGAKVVRAERIMHGKISKIYHDGRGLFEGISNPFEATRYHSLLVQDGTLPPFLEVTAHTSEGEIMGLRHKKHPIEGVQFHPESILTKPGKAMLRNFLSMKT
jgi:anthranilate synthase/aminodeoxychorismate synthase-like glutamine amidotransferase